MKLKIKLNYGKNAKDKIWKKYDALFTGKVF